MMFAVLSIELALLCAGMTARVVPPAQPVGVFVLLFDIVPHLSIDSDAVGRHCKTLSCHPRCLNSFCGVRMVWCWYSRSTLSCVVETIAILVLLLIRNRFMLD